MLGEVITHLRYQNQSFKLPLLIARGKNRAPLLGRDWMKFIHLDWKSIFQLMPQMRAQKINEIIAAHPSVFKEGIGTIKHFTADIMLKPHLSPIFHKPRSVPYALKEKVEQELCRLENNGVIVKVERSKWAAPIVVVPKANGSIRIYGDYKVTLNKVVEDTCYPLPTAEEVRCLLSLIFQMLINS